MDQLDRSDKKVAIWLLIGVCMTIIQVALGGITRLTGSGLSITEWNIITGILPPLNETAWMAEFHKYQQTPQFQLLNFEFTLKNEDGRCRLLFVCNPWLKNNNKIG